jgi:uncharacterized protein (DUF2141 family)
VRKTYQDRTEIDKQNERFPNRGLFKIVRPAQESRLQRNGKARSFRHLTMWLAFMLTAQLFSSLSVRGGDKSPRGTLNVEIVNLRNSRGQVVCTLFTPSDQFPDQSRKGMTLTVPIKNNHATCRFADLPYGYYAVVAFHDENHDGNFNQNWLGMPKEGFGFSDNPGTLKKPVFDDAKVRLDRRQVNVTIRLNYWF